MWKSDLPPNLQAPRRELVEWLVRNFRGLHYWSVEIDNSIEGLEGIVTYGASITDDAGDGTAHGDLNATDFTGHQYADPDVPTSLQILSNAVVTFGHKAIAYQWQGPSDVTLGIGGSYTAIATDLVPIGTADHNILVNRSLADQHPTSAITGLDTKQASQDADILANTQNINNHKADYNNPHQVNHSQLPDVDPDPNDPHPIYQKVLPSIVMGGTTDSFTLNTTDSKLVNYSLSGEFGGSVGNVDPTTGEITIPSDGIYTVTANVLGDQGNDTKEEWIELKLDVTVVGATRDIIGFLDVTTDKTSTRQLISIATRGFQAGAVLSLWMWASSGLGTFTVYGTSFEVHKLSET